MTEDSLRERSRRTLEAAGRHYDADPTEANTVWYGRVLGFRYQDSFQLLRQRGHRYISTRRFAEGLADLERAAQLIEGLPYWIEPDGPGNELPVPPTSIQFNTYYHLGLAHYLLRNWDAAAAFQKCRDWVPAGDWDGTTAATDWLYMTLRRAGRDVDAQALLATIPSGLADELFVEGPSYYRRLLMYRGELDPETLLNPDRGSQQIHSLETIYATQGYGVGNWYFYTGNLARAREVFERILEGRSNSAFGYIAAELDLAEMNAAG